MIYGKDAIAQRLDQTLAFFKPHRQLIRIDCYSLLLQRLNNGLTLNLSDCKSS